MLHSLNPARYCTERQLLQKWECCNCKQEFLFGKGYMFLAHFVDRNTQSLGYGLMCFCSDTCCLDFENARYMGKA